MSENYKKMSAHPLESVVFQAFQEKSHYDFTTLGCYLKGSTILLGKAAEKYDEAYRLVAEETLRCMEYDGKLVRDSLGWFTLAPAVVS